VLRARQKTYELFVESWYKYTDTRTWRYCMY
jgi:hypothetical protein